MKKKPIPISLREIPHLFKRELLGMMEKCNDISGGISQYLSGKSHKCVSISIGGIDQISLGEYIKNYSSPYATSIIYEDTYGEKVFITLPYRMYFHMFKEMEGDDEKKEFYHEEDGEYVNHPLRFLDGEKEYVNTIAYEMRNILGEFLSLMGISLEWKGYEEDYIVWEKYISMENMGVELIFYLEDGYRGELKGEKMVNGAMAMWFPQTHLPSHLYNLFPREIGNINICKKGEKRKNMDMQERKYAQVTLGDIPLMGEMKKGDVFEISDIPLSIRVDGKEEAQGELVLLDNSLGVRVI